MHETAAAVLQVPVGEPELVLADLLSHATPGSQSHLGPPASVDARARGVAREVLQLLELGGHDLFVHGSLHRVSNDLKAADFALPGELLFGGQAPSERRRDELADDVLLDVETIEPRLAVGVT